MRVYRKIYTTIVLARNPETGEPEPYTRGVRRNAALWKSIFGAATVAALGFASKKKVSAWWLIVALLWGYLMGHFFWP